MAYKANLHDSLPDGHRIHYIYAFDEQKMRPHYPYESDYAATVGTNNKRIISETLELHGQFFDEYNQLNFKEKK